MYFRENIKETIIQEPSKPNTSSQDNTSSDDALSASTGPMLREPLGIVNSGTNPLLSKSTQSADLFVSLKEKREKHKKDQLEIKDNSVEIPTKQNNSQENLKQEPVINITCKVVEEVKTEIVCQPIKEDPNLLKTSSIKRITPRASPNVTDAFITGEEGSRMDLSSMLERTKQFIYVFCIPCLFIYI